MASARSAKFLTQASRTSLAAASRKHGAWRKFCAPGPRQRDVNTGLQPGDEPNEDTNRLNGFRMEIRSTTALKRGVKKIDINSAKATARHASTRRANGFARAI